MKVMVKDKYLNVRVGKPSINAPCSQYIAPGSEIEVDGLLYKGDLYESIDTWFKDAAGSYYWSGGVNHNVRIENFLDISIPNTGNKILFNWFKQLGIQNIWNTYTEKGSLVTIAVLDTGYNKGNIEIAASIIAEKINIDPEQYPGILLIIDDQSDDGHGNRCSSIIASRNNLQWVTGIAPESNLLISKISINTELRNFQSLLDGIEWAINQGADIISISYSIELTKEEIAQWYPRFQKLLLNNNVLVFAAAGNSDGSLTTGERYPASFGGCISIGAVDENMNLSPSTILSSNTILHAPGMNIESFGKNGFPDPESGTSFSTPMVAAVAGLAISYLRRSNMKIDRNTLLNNLISSGDNLPGYPGKKIVNVENLFNYIKQ